MTITLLFAILVVAIITLAIVIWRDVDDDEQKEKPFAQMVARYNDATAANIEIKDKADYGWEVVSHNVNPDGSWYVIYKKVL